MRETWTKIASIERSGKHMSGEFNKPGNLLNIEVKDEIYLGSVIGWVLLQFSTMRNMIQETANALDGLVNYRKIPTSGL